MGTLDVAGPLAPSLRGLWVSGLLPLYNGGRALALTTLPGVYTDYGSLSFGLSGDPHNRATKARGVTGTFVTPDCSACLLTLATSVCLTGCELGPVQFSGMNLMTRVIGAALLAHRAVSCPVRLGSHPSGELCLGRYVSQSIQSFTSL